MLLLAAAPIPGRARAVRVHREPTQDDRREPVDLGGRDPHDGDRRAGGRGGGVRGLVREPRLRGLCALLRRCRHDDPVRARGRHRVARARRQRELDRDRAGGVSPVSRRATGDDDYSQAVLERAARLTAEVCARYEIPIRRLRASGLVAGRRGITGHADVSAAFHRSDHWDPGPAFPWERFLRLARSRQRRRARPPGLRPPRRAPRA